MNPYSAALVLFVSVILQVTVMPSAALGSAVPHLPLLVIVSWGYVRGARARCSGRSPRACCATSSPPRPSGRTRCRWRRRRWSWASAPAALADSIFMPAALAAAATPRCSCWRSWRSGARRQRRRVVDAGAGALVRAGGAAQPALAADRLLPAPVVVPSLGRPAPCNTEGAR
ncbi:MAG: hypothetical protein U0470_03245 [Anaerolineae bacterium]